jgi:hypothetical protein
MYEPYNIFIFNYLLGMNMTTEYIEIDERFIVEGYVDEIVPKVSPKDGRIYWVVWLNLLHERDGSFEFDFVTYYEPTFLLGDLIRIGISRRGETTLSSCPPYIVEKGLASRGV